MAPTPLKEGVDMRLSEQRHMKPFFRLSLFRGDDSCE